MNLEHAYERRFGKFPLSNITFYLIIGQVMAFISIYLNPGLEAIFPLQGGLVLHGQWWRVFTMLFAPLSLSPLWVVLDWYLMYIFGTALEASCGAFYYFVYLAIAYLAIPQSGH